MNEFYRFLFRPIERLIMSTKEQLESQIKELGESFESRLNELDDKIFAETSQQYETVQNLKSAIDTLEAKILQLQTEPSVPVDYSVDLSSLKDGLNRLDSSIAKVSMIVDLPEAPTEPVESEVVESESTVDF